MAARGPGLPYPWSFGVTHDGRIFFVNDETRTTTWLHPLTAEPLASGHQKLTDLPPGWERGVTADGMPYYIDHNKQETTLVHPVTKETAIQAEAIQSPPQQTLRPEDPANNSSNVAVPNMEAKKSPRKRVTGGNLRPPTVKRSNQAPVSMQGWLWKQGSDGFMRWKKRWFVLADFCLFYYKGPDEEKILGSILLPSYKISPCSNEGRVLRKFAFKAEHQNMRTYYFAADSKESAQQWMNAMSLASILQRDPRLIVCHRSLSDRHDPSHRSDSHNTSTANEDEDSGFTSYHSRRYLGSPQHDGNSTLNGSFASDPGGRLRADELHRDTASDSSHAPNERLVDGYLGSADKYPTSYAGPHPHFYNRNPNNPGGNGRPPAGYTNPPPKPKRLANQEVYGPSGGQHPPPTEQHQYIDGQPMEYPDYREEYPQYTGHPNEMMGVYANPQVMMAGDGGKYRVGHPQVAHPQEWVPQYEVYPGDYPNYPTHVQQPAQVYHSNHRGHTGRNDEANGSSQPSNDPPAYRDEYDPAVLREKGQRIYLAQRPHSANFLEYDYNPEEIYRSQDPSSMVRRPRSTKGTAAPTRPKSSIEQYDPDEYWSEQPNPAVASNPKPSYPQPQTQPHQVPHTPHTQNIPHSWESAQNNPAPGHDTSFESYSSSQGEGAARSPRGNNGDNSYPTPTESNGHGQREEPYRDGYPPEGKVASSRMAPTAANQARTLPRDAQFLRSASARLPSSHEMVGLPPYSRDDSLADNDPRRVQQREESMKRLLEWKQRMLQSPLTKKYPHQKSPQFPMATGIVNHPIPPVKKPEAEEYRKQVLQELANNEANKLNQGGIVPHMARIANQERSPQIQRAGGQPPPKRDAEGTNGTTNQHQQQFQPKGPQPAPNGSLVRSADNKHLMSATLNRYRNSYSSDDEESGSGSLKGLFISRTQPRQHGQRGKNEFLRDDLNMSDSELQVRGKLQNAKIRKYVHHPDGVDGGGSNSPRLSISAGDLLGKTHEELILLLIQLRRTQAKLQKAIDTCQMELEGEKKLLLIDTKNRDLHSMKVEELSKQLEEYAKQFDLSKPMVNLVDNMVKLGSLYGGSEQVLTSQYRLNELTPEEYAPPKKMIEFTRRLQEQRLLKEERLEWSQLVPDQADLQGKLQQLYQLDRCLQEESVNLTNLHQEKDMLERALLGIQAKANESGENVVEQERLLKQQRLVERELGKVHTQLVHTTKKLEETAAENAHIEHEILLLRQKIQQTLKMASAANPNISSLSVDDVETTELKLQLEEELAHVQNIMDELGKRRQEISGAVEQLKDKGHQVRPSPTGVAGSAPLPGRKFHRSTYLETDLDTMVTRDILDVSSQSDEGSPIPTHLPHAYQRSSQVPLYVNTNAFNNKTNGVYALTGTSSDYPPPPAPDDYHEAGDQDDLYGRQDINEADDRMKRFYGIIPREKPAEIKTVRIVKRESERRNKSKDRKKVSYDEQLLSKVIEEPDALLFEDFDYYEADYQSNEFQRSMSLPRNYGRATYLPASMQEGIPMMPPNSLPLTNSAAVSTTAVTTTTVTTTKILPNVPYYYRTPSLTSSDRAPTAHERLFGSGNPPLGSVPPTPDSPSSASPLATPVFKSEAARQIVAETAQQLMASLTSDPLHLSLEASPGGDTGSLKRRHKRRHYTISSSQPVALEAAPPKLVHARSRDDLDIERCLRSANTPDVVKSTIKKSDNFDESTIDRELGLPQKIVIPERYIEQEEEEPLSAEEKLHRIQKTESIRKMLSESTTYGDLSENEIANASETLKKKYEQEKKQREQLLSLNQLLAQEVKERSKAVAAHIPPRSNP